MSVETPLPWKQISILLAVRFSEPVAFTILFPFMYRMVKDFDIAKNESDIGFYAGLIASAFALAQFFSGIPWGILSDKIGRRPVILLGLMGTSISLSLFGLSKSLPFAIVTRILCGLLNGNVGVIKSMMAELTDNSNRARGFSLLPMMFGLGSIFGPTLGGFLSNPVTRYPSLFPDQSIVKSILLTYPYFLPCFISSTLCFISAIFGYFYLQETITISDAKKLLLCEEDDITYNAINNNINNNDNSISKQSFITMLGYVGLSLQTVMLDELLPIWLSTSINKGGLDFSPPHIGIIFSYGGIALLVIQIGLYSKIQKKLGSLKVYQLAYFIYTPLLLFYPLITLFNYEKLIWFYLLFLTTIRVGCGVFAFTSINILLAETCRNNKILGKINGIAQCLGSLMRAIGPTVSGLAFSWSLKNNWDIILFKFPFTFILISFISAIDLCVAYLIRT